MKISMFSLLVPLLIFTFFLFKWLKGSKKNLPPSPPKLPMIGNLHQLGFLPHQSLKLLAEKYGSIMLLHLGSKPTLISSSPTMAEMVLKTHDLNFSSRPKANSVGRLVYNFKDPAFAPYGEYWRQIKSSPVNVSELLVIFSNDIICRMAMGRRHSGEKSGSKFMKTFDECLELLGAF
ncbi:OLC1v1013462C1 [Oldenlandia corymbosa var. corymbosa]|uniref:OLC1v1013462C1 n=1 Tax=Oldenlandia corymbosa var. corymbosa TaxID=529605 RepID=A0AAV1E1T7_OLDCO|nr:OLC1v1013462C1 [Oldenlandia corymbosa var. corymbosa]